MKAEASGACGPARSGGAVDRVPLVVDLDGTLLRTDTLVESSFVLARRHPFQLLQLVLGSWAGRAQFKQRLAARTQLDMRALPVAHDLLEYLKHQKRQGRRLVLATGADERFARAAAEHFGFFDEVLASDGQVNLSGERKRDVLTARFGAGGFDYIGNSRRDLPVWRAARRALLVRPSRALQAAAARAAPIEHIFDGGRSGLSTVLNAMRVEHWPKNLLLLVPLLAAHRLYEPPLLGRALLALLSFSLTASAIYLLNDLFDLAADRHHPHKRERALASGRMPLLHALLLVPLLWLAAAAMAAWLEPRFLLSLATYAGLMIGYSMRLKDIAIVDALALALGYTLRIVAGSMAVAIAVAPWLIMCSMCLFFGLALLKRFAELVTLRPHVGAPGRVRGYRIVDATLVAAIGAAACCIAVALLALYPLLGLAQVASGPHWILCALLLLWTAHMWLMADRGRIHDDPVAFALRDPFSRGLGLAVAAVLLVAR